MDDSYTTKVITNPVAQSLGRIAVVKRARARGYLSEEVRRSVPTYLVSSLDEVRGALLDAERDAAAVLGLDICELPQTDTELVASEARGPIGDRGIVYLLTPEQFCLFEPGVFGYVAKE